MKVRITESRLRSLIRESVRHAITQLTEGVGEPDTDNVVDDTTAKKFGFNIEYAGLAGGYEIWERQIPSEFHDDILDGLGIDKFTYEGPNGHVFITVKREAPKVEKDKEEEETPESVIDELTDYLYRDSKDFGHALSWTYEKYKNSGVSNRKTFYKLFDIVKKIMDAEDVDLDDNLMGLVDRLSMQLLGCPNPLPW